MASISTDKSGNRRILYFDENRKRCVLYIGRISEREAEGVQRRVESMLAARILGNAIDRDDARWLSESPTIREKLERLNLISSGKIAVDRKSMTMEEFLDDYIERQGKRIRGRCAPVSSGCQHGDGLEELELTHRNDATVAPRRRIRLATIVPLDAGQPTNGTAT